MHLILASSDFNLARVDRVERRGLLVQSLWIWIASFIGVILDALQQFPGSQITNLRYYINICPVCKCDESPKGMAGGLGAVLESFGIRCGQWVWEGLLIARRRIIQQSFGRIRRRNIHDTVNSIQQVAAALCMQYRVGSLSGFASLFILISACLDFRVTTALFGWCDIFFR
ncbi:hypothetical protein DFH06DRAFT_1129724 [Mycena polygramma]|nr:hypothetical protein DFH06DRAFT_1129724 [Mycena polygramma]